MVLVPLTRWSFGGLGRAGLDPSVGGVGVDGADPMPWHNRPSSLAYDLFHVVLYLGSLRSWRCPRVFPVS